MAVHAVAMLANAFEPKKTTLLVPQKNRTGRLYLSGRAPGEADQLNEPKLLTGLLDEQVVMASCGARHTALVLGGGQVATCGDGAHGKLGHGTDEAKPEFILVAALGAVHISQVSCGREHTGFLDSEGGLWTCGLGVYGALGHGSLVDEVAPRRVETIKYAAAHVACGDLHTLFLQRDGRAFSCGLAAGGRLGLGLAADGVACVDTPKELTSSPAAGATPQGRADGAVAALSAGAAHGALVYANGCVATFGVGGHGQLGHGAPTDEVRPRKVMELVPHRVRVASCGAAHTLFLTSTGVAFACGLGSYGRLGTGARESLLTPRMLASLEQTVVVQVSAGARHSAFVTEGGQVYMAGDDGSGQCAANSHTALALRTPAVPPKFAEGTGATVLGASCGTDHTAYVLKTVVDAHFDLRADQIMKAAAVLQKIGRGAAVRRMRAPAAKKRVPQHASPQERRAARQADAKAEDDRRAAAAKVIQHGARSKAVRKKEAKADGVGNSLWGALRSRFAIASAAKQLVADANDRHQRQYSDW